MAKKRKQHIKSIMQDKEDRCCYLCRLLNNDYRQKIYLEEHHCLHGTSGRATAERLGLKVNLCLQHHRDGDQAVHFNAGNDALLKREAQRIYERDHSRDEWMAEVGRSYL